MIAYQMKERVELMNRVNTKGLLVTLLACLSLLVILGRASDSSAEYLLTEQELDDLLAPIALYPDPLLAQILPASTYPEEVADAADWLRSGGNLSGIDQQYWDENVRAIAHYPNILYMMADNMVWTASLGDAFLDQPEDVTMAIQRLRWRAQRLGNLVSSDQETVGIEGDYIQIVPAQPQYIYVPQYNPSVIYVQRWTPDIPPFITFGLGLIIGAWLDLDFDWARHHVFYHGWNRSGWVNHSRPYVHITNVYVQRSRPYINEAWRHDSSHGDPGRYWASRPGGAPGGRYAHTPEVRGRGTAPVESQRGVFVPRTNTQQLSNRGKESLRTISQRTTPQAPSVSRQRTSSAPTIFDGYRGPNEAKTQSMRGQASRQSKVGGHTPPAPVNRGGAHTGSRATDGGGLR